MKANLSEVNTSASPSDLINEYLSTSNAAKVSLSPATIFADNWFPEILTVKDFLIVRVPAERSTEEILFLGSFVYKVLSFEDSKAVLITLKSVTSRIEEDGKTDEVIPLIVWTSWISIEVVPTLTTLATTGSGKVVSVYVIKLFLNILLDPWNNGFGDFTVLANTGFEMIT